MIISFFPSKNIILNLTVISLLTLCLHAKSQQQLPEEVNLHPDYYKPYRSPLPTSYFYAELGFTKPRGIKKYSQNTYYKSLYRGNSFRIGIVRAFTLNKYKYDKNIGYLGKKGKFYGQFHFGWFYQKSGMSIIEILKGYDEVRFKQNEYLDFKDYTEIIKIKGIEIGSGIVKNFGNIFALEANMAFVALPSIKVDDVKIKRNIAKRRIFLTSYGIRIQHFSLNFFWSSISFKKQNSDSEIISSHLYSSYRTAFKASGWAIKYTYNF